MKSFLREKATHLFAALFLTLGLAFAWNMNVSAANVTAPTGVAQTDAGTITESGTYYGTSYISMKWNEVSNAVYYPIVISEDPNFATGVEEYGTAKTGGSIPGLKSGKTYYVQVGAMDENEDIEWAQAVKMVTVPDPVSKAAFTDATETSITVSWDAVAGATQYQVMYYPYGSDPKLAKVTTVKTTSVSLTGLSANTNYAVYIASQRLDGSYLEAVASARGFSALPTLPTKTTKLKCTYVDPRTTIGEADFSVNASASADGYQYEVYKYNGKKPIVTGTSAYNEFTVKNSKIKARQFYKIRVRAYILKSNGGAKYGAWSNEIYFSQCNYKDVKTKLVNDKVKVSWKKVTGATGYTVYLSTKSSSGYKKVGTTKKTSLTIKKKLKNYTNYYIRVVPNRKVKKLGTFSGTRPNSSFYSRSFRITVKYTYY